jgi:sterol-4alpha-carboxylate 3-dehydrogenase (decarboxylating)
MSSFPQEIPLGDVLVVGGCGFLGHHIVRELLSEPSCTSVSVMSREPFKNCFDDATYIVGDVTSPSDVTRVITTVKPTVIINTASPLAYIDHEHAPEYFTVNVDGNKNLLAAAAEVGTVKAFVYTSSGPIIAGAGGAYDHADETYPTLAVTKKGDPYHLAKALGDELVLGANGKNGILTACIRPTAMYGEGDVQMIGNTIKVLADGQTTVWLGYNDIEMDVVYVGHVARAEVLAAKGLLAQITNPDGPQVAGQAFNITDDNPSPPWTFFRMIWEEAQPGSTPLDKVWMIPPFFVVCMVEIAEFLSWALSWGKKRPELLIRERMEFILYTRTYSIKKAREVLGYAPWMDTKEAVKRSVDWYLKEQAINPVVEKKVQ